MPRVATGRPIGRPPKKNPQVVARILKIARTGLPLKFAAQAGHIDPETLAQWRVKDPEFDRALSQARLEAVETRWRQIQKAAQDRLDADGKLVKAGDWKSLAWQLERAYPAEFARPEFQLNLQTNFTQNNLSITIAPEEAQQIEAQAAPIREKVKAMFDAYRPGGRAGQSSGNGEGQRTVDIAAVATEVKDLAPITDKEDTPAFWRQFASGSGERSVSKEVAVYAAATIVNEALGRGLGHQAIVAFKSERVTVADVLAVIDRLCDGPAGWQLIQKKSKLT